MTMVLDGSGIVTTGVINSGTAVSTATGATLYDFTGIPAGVKRVTVMLSGVSTNGTSPVGIQVGSGSIQASGYTGTGWGGASASFQTTANWSAIAFSNDAGAATAVRHGAFTLTLVSGNTWVITAVLAQSDSARTMGGSGSVTLSGTLDRVRLTTVNGTDTFDAGSVNVFWE